MRRILGKVTGAVVAGGIFASNAGCILPKDASLNNFEEAVHQTGLSCFEESFTQPTAPRVGSVDLLFVVDTSGSLIDERGMIAQGIDRYIDQLPADVDYNIAVMLAHGSKSAWSGKLFSRNGVGPVLSSRTLAIEDIRSKLTSLMLDAASDHYSDGGEEGLYSLLKGMAPEQLEVSRQAGFFRPDAALAVVFVADENDICAVYPDGVTPVRDPDGLEVPAKARDCSGVTVEAVRARTKEVMGELPFFFGGILYVDPQTVSKVGENEVGYGYLDLVRLDEGEVVDLARGDFVDGLSDLGRLTVRKATLFDSFTLNQAVIQPSSIQVSVDGSKVDFDFDPETNQLRPKDYGKAGSVVKVNYCVNGGGAIGD